MRSTDTGSSSFGSSRIAASAALAGAAFAFRFRDAVRLCLVLRATGDLRDCLLGASPIPLDEPFYLSRDGAIRARLGDAHGLRRRLLARRLRGCDLVEQLHEGVVLSMRDRERILIGVAHIRRHPHVVKAVATRA